MCSWYTCACTPLAYGPTYLMRGRFTGPLRCGPPHKQGGMRCVALRQLRSQACQHVEGMRTHPDVRGPHPALFECICATALHGRRRCSPGHIARLKAALTRTQGNLCLHARTHRACSPMCHTHSLSRARRYACKTLTSLRDRRLV